MITLRPITINFHHTESFTIDDYLEYCEDQDINPTQKHYTSWAIENMESGLLDDIDTDKFAITTDLPREVDFEINDIMEAEELKPLCCEECVSDLTEDEIKNFHNLLKLDSLIVVKTENNIIIVENSDNNILKYGVIVDDQGHILIIKKSVDSFCLLMLLKELLVN
jgi:hypothetical protein